eukprot:Sspe_Gene.101307::Locus_75901_Transcript_1_2_Confidence_0.750_Length_783::g.101307::m.101307
MAETMHSVKGSPQKETFFSYTKGSPRREERRFDPGRGDIYSLAEFISYHGESNGLIKWINGKTRCWVQDCSKEHTDIYCMECDKWFCSKTCLVHYHRRAQRNNHTRIMYTLDAAKRVIESGPYSDVGTPPRYSPGHESPPRSHYDIQQQLAALQAEKASAVAAEDFSRAHELKEAILALQHQMGSPRSYSADPGQRWVL